MTTRELSQDFKDFMIALKAWVDAGCPEPTKEQRMSGEGFRKNDSICFQIERWSKDKGAVENIGSDLEYLFDEQFQNSLFPFNKPDDDDNGSSDYEEEMDAGTHYENLERVKWINDTVASFDKNKNKD